MSLIIGSYFSRPPEEHAEFVQQLKTLDSQVKKLSSLILKGPATSGTAPLTSFYDETRSLQRKWNVIDAWTTHQKSFEQNLTGHNYTECFAVINTLLQNISNDFTTQAGNHPGITTDANKLRVTLEHLQRIQETLHHLIPPSLESSLEKLTPVVLKGTQKAKEDKQINPLVEQGYNLPLAHWNEWRTAFQGAINVNDPQWKSCDTEIQKLLIVLENYLTYATYKVNEELSLQQEERTALTERVDKMHQMLDGLIFFSNRTSIETVSKLLYAILINGDPRMNSSETLVALINEATNSFLVPFEGWDQWLAAFETHLKNGQFTSSMEMLKSYARDLRDFLSSSEKGLAPLNAPPEIKAQLVQVREQLNMLVQADQEYKYTRRFGPALSLGGAGLFALGGIALLASAALAPIAAPVVLMAGGAGLLMGSGTLALTAKQFEENPQFATDQAMLGAIAPMAGPVGPALETPLLAIAAHQEWVKNQTSQKLAFAVGTVTRQKREELSHRPAVKSFSFRRRTEANEAIRRGSRGKFVSEKRGVTATLARLAKTPLSTAAPFAFAPPTTPVDFTPMEVDIPGFGNSPLQVPQLNPAPAPQIDFNEKMAHYFTKLVRNRDPVKFYNAVCTTPESKKAFVDKLRTNHNTKDLNKLKKANLIQG